MVRPPAIEAAKQFIEEHYSSCQAAILAGSVVRGEETSTSDLDIVVIDHQLLSEYRESLIVNGWPIEVFVHNENTIRHYFESDCKRARPSLPRMVSEGIPLVDHPLLSPLKSEARALLRDGPPNWSAQTIQMKRYFLTDALDDLIGSTNRPESIFIAGTVAEALHEFVLRTNGQWIGSSKWIVRALNEYDPHFANEFVEAFEQFYRSNDKHAVVGLVDSVLEAHGGRLFHGFSIGKK
ncbi:nucleotidyltransferase domain-containing protein [Rossellomorea aquimaris]|uniref:nucleotidyltransferase domain-containing protein n=1 Tax=Rossellomorea TaxID=2837508 RepID=UPI001CD6DEF8|nr:nucleotidyltransferase domain-containing protein [Rossellomorea aquimaris]MCA1058783.1 nucleotidyltransferase domain-containing protein [Rossellomorea aquimaris]